PYRKTGFHFSGTCADNSVVENAAPARAWQGRAWALAPRGAAGYRCGLSRHNKGPNPMIDLYALTSPNVQKIYIMLEECGLPYKEHFVDVWKGDQYKPEFIKINPNSKIPAIVDQDGPGGKPLTVIESGAILIYLAEKTGKFLPKDAAKRYE